MPGYKTHAIVYLILAFAIYTLLHRLELVSQSLVSMWLGLVVGLVYSLLPDIDMPSSKIRKKLEQAFLGLTVVMLLLYVMLLRDMVLVYVSLALAVGLLALWFARHRGRFHTLGAAVLFSLPLGLVDPICMLFGFTGYLSHLLIDRELF